jgi:hypothetical protein
MNCGKTIQLTTVNKADEIPLSWNPHSSQRLAASERGRQYIFLGFKSHVVSLLHILDLAHGLSVWIAALESQTTGV